MITITLSLEDWLVVRAALDIAHDDANSAFSNPDLANVYKDTATRLCEQIPTSPQVPTIREVLKYGRNGYSRLYPPTKSEEMCVIIKYKELWWAIPERLLELSTASPEWDKPAERYLS